MRSMFETIELDVEIHHHHHHHHHDYHHHHRLLKRSIIMLNYSVFAHSSDCNSKKLFRKIFGDKYMNI